MNAEQLVLHPNKATLPELIDAHNALVRHVFANANEVVQVTNSPFVPVVEQAQADLMEQRRAAYTLLLLWGFRCLCLTPKLIPNLQADIAYCAFCSKPYQEPLRDE